MEIKETKIPSFGEQLIGVEYTPDTEDTVLKIKSLFAEIAEIMKKEYVNGSKHPLKSLLFDHAVGEIVNAEAAVTKVITIKHYTENEING